MRIRLTVPGEPNAETLGIALEAATRLAQHDIAQGDIPPIEDAIHQGIEWQPEPPGDESFDKPSTVLARGWGDCDDLAPWLAGEMRETGFDPGASAIAIPSGHRMWHAIVRGSDGMLYDPSKWAGMPHDVVGQGCACSKPLNPGKVAVSIGRKLIRVDVPGLQSRRGCVMGVSHQCSCAPNDEDQIRALIQAIEDAIVTAQLARTGDKRAIKQLAVLYRVLRGDDPDTACNGVHIRPDQVGMDFSASSVRNFVQRAREVLATAADELFNGETWTAQNGRIVKARKVALSGGAHRVGILPCLGVLGPLASAAATAGTIAAVVDPIALALRELAGKDSDFGKAMAVLREGLGPVKLASSLGTGLIAMAAGGIPAGVQATAARWIELLRAPGSAAALNDVSKAPDVAKVLSWAERALATAVPPQVATMMTPEVVDLLRHGKYEQAVSSLATSMVKNFIPPGLAETLAVQALKALADHAEELGWDQGPGVHVPRMPTFDPNAISPSPEAPAVHPAEVEDAENVRDEQRTVPIIVRVPSGWDPVFAMGCRQITDQCP